MKRLLVAAICLAVAARLCPPAETRRPVGGAPPVVSLAASALSGLNGLVASYLWLYADRQLAAGQPFDQQRTVRLITALQPEVGGWYPFGANHLAYDVAEGFGRPEERWPWVAAGIDLLYRRALAERPYDPKLAGELASLLLGRVCGGADDADAYYQQAFAQVWSQRLGPPVVDWAARATAAATWNLDAAAAARLDDELGGLDWRLGWPHAIYWSRQGLGWQPRQAARRTLWSTEIEALRGACLNGTLLADQSEGVFVTAPAPQLVARLERVYEAALADQPRDEGLRANQQTWQEISAPLRLAFGLGGDADAARSALLDATGGDAALARAVAVSDRQRAYLCAALGRPDLASGLASMAQQMAEAHHLDWPTVELEAGSAVRRLHLTQGALNRAGL